MARVTPRAAAVLPLLLLLLSAGSGCAGGVDDPASSDTAEAADTSPADDTPAAKADASAVTEACPAGALGCACAEGGACGRGQCVAGICALCTRGEAACLCRGDGSCRGDLLCRDGLCEACPPGELGCACQDGACGEGGACQDGVCAPVDCTPGTDACPCRRRSTPACDAPLLCLGDGACHLCAADRAGCACDGDGACASGLLCDGATCRAPRSCDVLVSEGFCGEHERCIEGSGLDAECRPGECEPGFVFDRGRCVAGRPNCLFDQPGSLLDTCTSLLRQCDDDGTTATCGACIDDARELGGECVGRLSCGDRSCLNSQYCDATGAEPTCRALPCAPGEARGDDGVCRACGFTCAGTGLTGRVWPFRTNTSTCICETVRGYFMPPGGDTRPEVCDIDGDGWVREEVRDPALTSDPALTANARCDLVETSSAAASAGRSSSSRRGSAAIPMTSRSATTRPSSRDPSRRTATWPATARPTGAPAPAAPTRRTTRTRRPPSPASTSRSGRARTVVLAASPSPRAPPTARWTSGCPSPSAAPSPRTRPSASSARASRETASGGGSTTRASSSAWGSARARGAAR